MPREEWKRKHQKEPIKGSKRGPKCSAGPLKEAAKSSARSVEKTAQTNLDEHHNIENELLILVAQLKNRRRINGKPCTLNELLDPEEEREIGENTYAFEGGDADIVGFVQEEMVGDIEEIDSDDEDPNVAPPSLKEMLDMCQIIQENSMVVCTEGSLEVVKVLRKYRGHLQRMRHEGERQATLDTFFPL